METFAKPGDFCPNEMCQEYGKLQDERQQNIKKAGLTAKGVQRYQCKSCGKTFTATYGTIFYGKRTLIRLRERHGYVACDAEDEPAKPT